MKCPHCGKDIADNTVVSHAAKIIGKRSRRTDGGGARCPKHGLFMRRGVCPRCEREKEAQNAGGH